MAHNAAYMAARASERLEDLRWMIETGENATGAAQRLGVGLEALWRWCQRHDAVNEWLILRSRDPIALTDSPGGTSTSAEWRLQNAREAVA